MRPSRPTPGIQIFGRRDSRDTQKALRFFKERRIPVVFVDAAVRPPSSGELGRFSRRFGESALLDTTGRRYQDLGLAHMRFDEGEVLERLLADPSLLRLPLVRFGDRVSIGPDEATWKAWLRPAAP